MRDLLAEAKSDIVVKSEGSTPRPGSDMGNLDPEIFFDTLLYPMTCQSLTSFASKEMTLEEYEKVPEEKRKALLALKAEERKVEIDRELRSMQQLSVIKDADEVFIKLGSDKDLKKKENVERDERAKKFLKLAEGERYCNPSGHERGGFRRGYNGGYRGPAAAPAIQDQAQFPALA
ncbi:hypothetical protein C2845_PM15G24450 [Panicum miliaceum]|uniref:Hyaluronan/mRNA-binding protein domain-containing protein n=1 Tax=Panicum miliaceum TaxID=4540 RepID=A0A3L6Q623_PANMI|nr:hypothetical protein C2845_PM15G24450 [Panicum miliaceum]